MRYHRRRLIDEIFKNYGRFPKTYPALACPIFTIQKPTLGLNNEQIMRLSSAIHAEAQKQRGIEMVFQVNVTLLHH